MTRLGAHRKVVVSVLMAALLAACGGGGSEDGPASGDATSESSLVSDGRELYEQTCAMCHGSDLRGTDLGPPFLDPIYAPNHHPDGSFYAAVANGVEPHHWDFGAMPAQPAVAPEDVAAIVAFVRSEQEKAGITEDPSHP